jgi:hypothetical protein
MNRSVEMPTYLHVHNLPGVTATDVAEAHLKDLQSQGKYGVRYMRYWIDERQGKVFCLVYAPDAETAEAVHREAHGNLSDEVYEVEEGS